MFERFTPRARRVIVLAQDAARDMGHAQIKPAHLLVGLQQGEGMAAKAMTQAGVDGARCDSVSPPSTRASQPPGRSTRCPSASKERSAWSSRCGQPWRWATTTSAPSTSFSASQSQAESNGQALDEVLGASTAEIHLRLTEMLGGTTSGPAMRSPALHAALDRARAEAGPLPMTCGHVLSGMLADPESLVSHAFATMGVDPQRVQAALDAVNIADTSDASPVSPDIAITIGGTTTVIADPEIAAALQISAPTQLRDMIRKAIDRSDPGQAAG